MNDETWINEFPKETGLYWFYGYRYGKFWGEKQNDPEFAFCEAIQTSNSILIKAEGTIMFESEVEEPYFMKTEHPTPPKGF